MQFSKSTVPDNLVIFNEESKAQPQSQEVDLLGFNPKPQVN